jgi:hypothetical protein
MVRSVLDVDEKWYISTSRLPYSVFQNYTESFLRPILRRRERVLRPPFVDIRTRNPWVVLRFFLFGLYVIDMAPFYSKTGYKSNFEIDTLF